jgi:UDP:flavonoid glycosyltransferase YjiC (YdhE family)
MLKDSTFELYSKDKAYKSACMASWYAYYTKLNMNIATTITAKEVRAKLGGKVQHLFCWDKAVTRSIEPAFKASLNVHQPGTLYTPRYAAKAWYSPEKSSKAPAALLKWLKDAPTLLVSFGSYSASQALQVAQPLMLRVLDEFGIRVLYHATNAEAAAAVENTPHRRVHQGWLPYEWAVPRCAAVLFTGSVCLQSVCAYNATPMIFCPLLAEQFFWARNYQAMTGTPYVSYMGPEADVVTALLRAWFEKDGARTRAYLTRCAKSIKRHDGSKRVADIIVSVVVRR